MYVYFNILPFSISCCTTNEFLIFSDILIFHVDFIACLVLAIIQYRIHVLFEFLRNEVNEFLC